VTAQDVLGRLVTLFPDFAACWDSPDNCFRDDDGSFTRCGVFAEFSDYFRDRYEQLPTARVADLGCFVTECMTSPDTELGDAAATCFLENVASERFSPDFRQHLSGEALRFYSLMCPSDHRRRRKGRLT
jgi:hypothetical protein